MDNIKTFDSFMREVVGDMTRDELLVLSFSFLEDKKMNEMRKLLESVFIAGFESGFNASKNDQHSDSNDILSRAKQVYLMLSAPERLVKNREIFSKRWGELSEL